jgi:hypothetical protein
METLKEKKVKETLDKMFGNRESAKEVKQVIYMSQTGKLTDEVIENYRKQKELELEQLRQQFNELNPSYAFDYPKETETIIISNSNIDEQPISER